MSEGSLSVSEGRTRRCHLSPSEQRPLCARIVTFTTYVKLMCEVHDCWTKTRFWDSWPLMCEADIKRAVRLQALCGFVYEPDAFHGVVVGMMRTSGVCVCVSVCVCGGDM